MTPHNINVKRFQNLLGFGINGDALMQFFRENKTALLRAAVKVDNLPANAKSARRTVEGFNEKAHGIMGTWIAQKFAGATGPSAEQLVARFRSAEEAGVELTQQEREEFAKVGLLELYREQPSPMWIDFLRTPIGSAHDQVSPIARQDWVSLASWWLGKGPQPSGTDSIVAAVAKLSDAIDRGDSEVIKDVRALTEAAEDLTRLIQTASNSEPARSAQRGAVASGPAERVYDPEVDYTDFTVIATNRSAKTTEPFFVVAEAFIDHAGEVFTLSPDDIRKAIPSDARIVLHGDKGFPTAPALGEAFAYRVEMFRTDLPVKVKAVERIPDRLLRVVHIPVSSKEAHKIRDYIVEYSRTPSTRSAVFVTLDKVCLRPRADSVQRVLAADFDWRLERWDSLHAVELANGAYIVAPLPQTTKKGLDCSPLSQAARRLVKTFSERSEFKMQKSQRDTLQELLVSDQFGFEESTRERLLANIDAIDRGSKDFETLIDELMQSTAIKADVERRVTDTVEALTLERTKQKQSIEQLQREKENWERKIEKLRDEADKKSRAVRGAIQKAFANASTSGMESLGQQAVFEALFARSAAGSRSPPAADRADEHRELTWAHSISPSTEGLSDVLRQFGIRAEYAHRAEGAIRLGIGLGLPIVCSGVGAADVCNQIAASLCSTTCVVADVPIGLTRSADLRGALQTDEAGGLLLRNANLSDISVYAPNLLSVVVQRALERHAGHHIAPILIATASGPAALPLPWELTQLAIRIDLNELETTLGSDAVQPAQDLHNPLWRKIWAKVQALEDADSNTEYTFADLYRLVL